jgi:alkylhydroperoxidase/carboxymuconolactone decarboxylase family protein YurZ
MTRDRRADGIAAFASQYRVAEGDVVEHMTQALGARLAAEALDAGGAVWNEHSALSLRERSLVVVAAIAAQGGMEARLRGHVRWAFDHGATPAELDALVGMLAVYCGYPRAASAMDVIREVSRDLAGEDASTPSR